MPLGKLWATGRNGLNRFFRETALFLVLFYQHSLSLIFGGNCRFHPSCSHYATEAYRQHSFVTATLLVSRRLAKCRPGGPYGVDLVPKPSQLGVLHGSPRS